MKRLRYWAVGLLAALTCCQTPETDKPEEEQDPTPVDLPKALVITAKVDGVTVPSTGTLGGASLTPVISLGFSRDVKVDEESLAAVSFNGGDLTVSVDPSDASYLQLTPKEPLKAFKNYRLSIAEGDCFGVKLKKSYSLVFTTGGDNSDKFPRIPDEDLLTLVQQQTFKYFWNYAHPVCGLARERWGSGDTVTAGASGFGIMCIPVGVERGWITREEAVARMRTIVDFLENKADRFHGAWSHWINGSTGKVIPFGDNDNGGDLVETSFMIEGLLTVAQYFSRPEEADIREAIDRIWRGVEWDWYTRGGQDVLYWHWSPDKDWIMNMKVRGWNEGLITYILAVSSPTHPVSVDVYHKGWASNSSMKPTQNGPLFFSHYSFLGLNPHGLKDRYADYWAQNVAHARYNYDYCVRNPGGHAGYSASCWGLTASDYPGGYIASAPSNDTGTIAPTAAVSSIPYTPDESMEAIRTFYYKYGDKLWGDYGFRDAFCLDSAWFASSYIAIDQGPIVVMIENYRSGLLWDLFMADPDVQNGLTRLEFEFQAGE